MSRVLVTPHFHLDEFACRCPCGRISIDQDLPRELEKLRAIENRAIYILSGSRCWCHNHDVGGVENSRHLCERGDGRHRESDAADIIIAGRKPRQIFQLAMKVPRFKAGGIGVYEGQGFVHLDIRPGRARWFVKEKGDKATSIPANYY